MTEKRRTRRRFLADLLFAGAGLTVATVVVRGWSAGEAPSDTPETPGPLECEKPEVVTDVLPEDIPMPGAVAVPEPELTPTPEAIDEVVPRGRVAVPVEPRPDGGMVMPAPEH